MKLECGGKSGLFVNEGDRGEGQASKEIWEKANRG